MEQSAVNLHDQHKKLAIQYFNETWNLIDKTDRNREDDLLMIHMAHASRYHWGEVGTPLHFLRGEWQVSRVYALVGLGESALYHAQHCLDMCLANNIGDFDLAFAHEALARAHMVLGQEDKKLSHLRQAEQAAEHIAKQGDKDYLLSELQTIK